MRMAVIARTLENSRHRWSIIEARIDRACSVNRRVGPGSPEKLYNRQKNGEQEK